MLSSSKLLFEKDRINGDKIKDLMSFHYNRIRILSKICELSVRKKGDTIEHYLCAWPHSIKICINSKMISVYFINECEGVSHEGIREEIRQLVDKIKDI